MRSLDVAVLGHGRFGRALADLAEDAGLRVGAYDPVAAIEGARRHDEPLGLVREAPIVILAMPVPSMRAVLEEVGGALDPDQLVLDVGSVKVVPTVAMKEVLGTRVPWAATHPLFGPTSLALAERPLRVVIAPNPLHPEASARARAFYERLGCWTLEQDAHAHDKAMADTHALAFFVAKGMLDAGVDTRVPFAPPSFQAIARTVDVVRGDAGHLFAAICADNPYAEGARARLLDALSAVHGALASASPAAPLSIPEGAPPPSAPDDPTGSEASRGLAETRDRIDELDGEIVALLARRAELSRRARLAKLRAAQPIHDSGREAQVLSARRRLAQEHGLPEDSIEDVFRAVLRFSRRIQG